MASPELQTVLTLTSGSSDQTRKAFRWGTAVPPIHVGTRAEWYVHAPGVLGVHLYLAFDGRLVHVAAAAGARVTVGGVEVGQEWMSVPVRAEVRFGNAAIAVSCEEVPLEAGPTKAVHASQLGTGFTTAPPPSPGLVRTLIVRETKPTLPPAERKPALAAAPANAGPGNTRPMAVATSTVAVAPTVTASAPPAAPAHVAALPTAIMSAAAFAPAGSKAVPPMRPVALEPPAPGEVTPPPPLAQPETASQYESAPTTMIDGGLLRDHAHRIASMAPDQAEAAAQEYAALVKRRAGGTISDPPALTMTFGAQGQENRREPVAVAAPETPRTATLVAGNANLAVLGQRMAKSWKETSTVKKVILFILPFAAAATLLEREPPPATEPAPAQQTQTPSAVTAKRVTKETSTPAASATAAPPPATPSAAPASTAASAPAASAAPPIRAASAEPVASATSSAAPSVAFATTPAASASPATTSPSKVAANDPAADKGKQASDEPDPEQRATTLGHMALAAAFGGNLAQASTMYSKLAELKPEAQVFALAARLTKEGAVRTP